MSLRYFLPVYGNITLWWRTESFDYIDHLRENMGALNVQLTPADLSEIEMGFSRIEIHGGRMDARQMAQINQMHDTDV